MGAIVKAAVSVALAVVTLARVDAPPPNAPIPRDPPRLARALADTATALRAAIDGWRTSGNLNAGGPPREVTLDALYEQRIVLLLSHDRRLARRTIPLLPAKLARAIHDNVTAKRELDRITPVSPRRKLRTGPALPAGVLLRYYGQAQRRFGVAWQVLAAINFVETAFNRLRNASAAGAQGPMQFMPSTWRRYGMGGNIHDPHDAIMAAANYLHASGAPRDYRRALRSYNPSSLYVDAVLRYARHIERDQRDYLGYYSWQVFVRTRHGQVRLTGPGR